MKAPKDPSQNLTEKVETTQPDYIKHFILEIREVNQKGKTYTYLIVDEQGFGKTVEIPKIFATCSKEGLISISSNYPEKYRELGIAHEIRERTEHNEESGCCLACLKTELEDLEKTDLDKKEYIEFRIYFFEEVIKYYQSREKLAPNEVVILANLIESRDYLLELLKTI